MILGTVHLDGRPQPKQRPRTVDVEGSDKKRTYTPPATVAYEALIAMSWRGPRGFTGSVKVTIAVIEDLRQNAGDVDNYAKIVLDALNHVAWVDDKQVIALDAKVHRKDARPGLDVIVEGWEAEAAPAHPAQRATVLPAGVQLRRGRGR